MSATDQFTIDPEALYRDYLATCARAVARAVKCPQSQDELVQSALTWVALNARDDGDLRNVVFRRLYLEVSAHLERTCAAGH